MVSKENNIKENVGLHDVTLTFKDETYLCYIRTVRTAL